MNQNQILSQLTQNNPAAQRMVDQYQQITQMQEAMKKPSSRDHQATMGDEELKKVMAISWPAWDSFFSLMQRELADMPKGEEHEKNLNAIFLTFSQIINRALTFVDEGNLLRGKEEALRNNATSSQP